LEINCWKLGYKPILMRISLFLFFLFIAVPTHAQDTLGNIDMKLIPQKSIRDLLQNQFSEIQLQPTVRKGQDLRGYHHLESIYRLREVPERVWKTYQVTSPAESWNGRMVSFGLMISKWENLIMYRNDQDFGGIDTGQIYYINLSIMQGLYNLAVGLEIIDIDTTNKSITFSYMQGGKSRGKQTIFFLPTKNGFTEIIHQTAFKSDSYIRDRYLYPYFHRIAINEFHRNMKRSLQGEPEN